MPAAIPIIVGAVSAAGAVGAAKMASNAAQKAAQTQATALGQSTTTQTDAAKYAADLQQKQAAAALQFTKQQAETDWRNQELARQANYDQWRAREGSVSAFGQTVGLPSRSIPAYAAGIDPNYTGGGGAPATLAGAAQGPTSGNVTDPSLINAKLTDVYKSLGVTPTGPGSGPTDIAYMAQKVADTGGWTPQNASYWPQRIADELAKSRGGGASAATPAASPYATMAQAALPYRTPTITPALQLPGTLAGLAR